MAAEFFGNCQICGREHKASAASVAKHGYTIRDGWQEGACYGSGGKPIQISCDLIQRAIDFAKSYVERTEGEIDQLKAEPLFDGGTVQMLVRRATRHGELIYPIKVTVELNEQGLPVARGADGKIEKEWPFYMGVKTIEAAAAELANMRIGYLTKTIAQAKESITYLADRLKNWKPAELRPVTAADRTASAAKVHMAAKKWGYNTSICVASASAAGTYKMTTAEREKVTCAACLKELARIDDLPRVQAEAKAKERAAAIKDAERDIKNFQAWIKSSVDPMEQLRWTADLTKATQRLNDLKAQ